MQKLFKTVVIAYLKIFGSDFLFSSNFPALLQIMVELSGKVWRQEKKKNIL